MEQQKNKLIEYFGDIRDEEKLQSYLQKFKPFGKDTQGKSGSLTGTLPGNRVLKIMKFRMAKKSITGNRDCIFLNPAINEIFIHSNLQKVKDDNRRIRDKYLLKLLDFGLGKDRLYLVTEEVGVDGKTNMHSMMMENHLPLLKKNTGLINSYDKFLTSTIRQIDSFLEYFQKKVDFYHSDMKLQNVFIKRKKVSGYKNLRGAGMKIDFIPLLADLDKSRMKKGKFKYLPSQNSRIETLVHKITKSIPLIDIRYRCDIKYGVRKCTIFKDTDFDILSVIISTSILLAGFKFDIRDFSVTQKFIKNRFKLDKKNLEIFNRALETTSLIIKKDSVMKISNIIEKLCRKLEY
jgi:hypothetical protein